jgi:hypothetical protein
MGHSARAKNTLNLRKPSNKAGERLRDSRAELQKALAEATTSKAEAVAARESAEKARHRLAKSKRDAKVRMRVTAVLMMTAALFKLGWEAAHETPTIAKITRSAKTALNLTASAQMGKDPTIDNSDGGKALNRIRSAFELLPELDQPEVVRQVNARNPGSEKACPIVWDDGHPSLFVGDKEGTQPISIAATLNRCSTEIERLRADLDAQQAN